MQRSGPRRDEAGTISFNAVPMVDVIFLLTIFFMLVTRFSSAEQVPMELPEPEQSRAETVRLPERVIINCRPADADDPSGSRVLYSVGPNPPEALEAIADRLATMKQRIPHIDAVIRADRHLAYADVRVVMEIVAATGIDVLNVVAHVAEDEGGR